MDVIINNANTATATNPNFNKIKSNVSWLAQNADKEFSLNKAKYEFDVNQQKSVLKEIDAAYKLSKLLNVKNMVSDSLEVNASKDKMKIERNKQFVKKIGEDIYIDAAVDILNKMIVNDNVVKIK
jgi:carboxyl-terminal processing protease